LDVSHRIGAVMALEPSAPTVAQDGRWHSWGELGAQIGELSRDLPRDAAVGLVTRNDAAVFACMLDLFIQRRAVLTLNPLQPDAALAAEVAELRPRSCSSLGRTGNERESQRRCASREPARSSSTVSPGYEPRLSRPARSTTTVGSEATAP